MPTLLLLLLSSASTRTCPSGNAWALTAEPKNIFDLWNDWIFCVHANLSLIFPCVVKSLTAYRMAWMCLQWAAGPTPAAHSPCASKTLPLSDILISTMTRLYAFQQHIDHAGRNSWFVIQLLLSGTQQIRHCTAWCLPHSWFRVVSDSHLYVAAAQLATTTIQHHLLFVQCTSVQKLQS